MLSLNRHVEAARAPHHGQAQPALTGRSGGAREHGFVQPDVQLCRIPHQIGRTAQLRGQLLARAEAAVDIKELKQVDDRGSPVQLLRIRRRALLQLRHDIDDRNLLLRVRDLLARYARNQRECG